MLMQKQILVFQWEKKTFYDETAADKNDDIHVDNDNNNHKIDVGNIDNSNVDNYDKS